ncbi:rod shape-determining protein RodA [Dysgonomonas sp. 25]|uniref:rod shape-determining protein RodA n=1 Tax=Dysgonomonas sp. 25 TaxID=2302933 RepID=UPI0013CFBE12|nr:rod shape-determining protein RodA [Dysgonomonas sp. 25]NDV67540.1 rod shape-determining protein RodA [Dysgonomonas sp. 25]
MYERKEDSITSSVDWVTIVLFLVMIVAGWISIYSASYDYENVKTMFDLSGRAGKQLVWMGTSIVLAFVILKLDSRTFDTFAYLVYAGLMLLLFITIFIAPDIKGSRSWLVITNDIRLQPAEFAKFATALALAKFMSSYNFKLMNVKNLTIVCAMIALPMSLILLQQETGSALVFISFMLVLYRQGLPGIVLFAGLATVVLFIIGLKYSETDMGLLTQGEFITTVLVVVISAILVGVYIKKGKGVPRNILIGGTLIYGAAYLLYKFGLSVNWGIVGLVAIGILTIYLIVLTIKQRALSYLGIIAVVVMSIAFVSVIDNIFNDVLKPHQQVRIKVVLGMEEDKKGAGYNVNQSKIAIGSGGFAGKGFLDGTQTKLKYVPEQDTDFIFCTVGEEEGFIGTVATLALFVALILRLIFLSERQKNAFGRVYGYCVAGIIFFHLAINVGMVIGLTPVIGIPLPFFSYGGSSLWGFTILLFVFLRIDMTRKRRTA